MALDGPQLAASIFGSWLTFTSIWSDSLWKKEYDLIFLSPSSLSPTFFHSQALLRILIFYQLTEHSRDILVFSYILLPNLNKLSSNSSRKASCKNSCMLEVCIDLPYFLNAFWPANLTRVPAE